MKLKFARVLLVLSAIIGFVVVFTVSIFVVWAHLFPVASGRLFSVTIVPTNLLVATTLKHIIVQPAQVVQQVSQHVRSWHVVEVWYLGAVSTPLMAMSLEVILNRLSESEGKVDDGEDGRPARDKWKAIIDRIEAIHNILKIISDEVNKAFTISIQFARRLMRRKEA